MPQVKGLAATRGDRVSSGTAALALRGALATGQLSRPLLARIAGAAARGPPARLGSPVAPGGGRGTARQERQEEGQTSMSLDYEPASGGGGGWGARGILGVLNPKP